MRIAAHICIGVENEIVDLLWITKFWWVTTNYKCYRQLVLLTIWNAVAAAVAGFAYQTDIDY